MLWYIAPFDASVDETPNTMLTLAMTCATFAKRRQHPHPVMLVTVEDDVKIYGPRAKAPARKISPQRLLCKCRTPLEHSTAACMGGSGRRSPLMPRQVRPFETLHAQHSARLTALVET